MASCGSPYTIRGHTGGQCLGVIHLTTASPTRLTDDVLTCSDYKRTDLLRLLTGRQVFSCAGHTMVRSDVHSTWLMAPNNPAPHSVPGSNCRRRRLT
ncbi:uncharacterized protein LOC121879395 isoform X4 [Homarus americanus]|uniref:uncharacterized protein LOC121879395 isoform X4 n=1 Tax=Homarus americanus TaxID=6706 RepID=UPI001C469D39|nr:uncharacterized protein LOC121879395 isoform X4 [Homarus americanus]